MFEPAGQAWACGATSDEAGCPQPSPVPSIGIPFQYARIRMTELVPIIRALSQSGQCHSQSSFRLGRWTVAAHVMPLRGQSREEPEASLLD